MPKLSKVGPFLSLFEQQIFPAGTGTNYELRRCLAGSMSAPRADQGPQRGARHHARTWWRPLFSPDILHALASGHQRRWGAADARPALTPLRTDIITAQALPEF